MTIFNGVTSIAGSAFSNCTNLESVTIPESVTSIGSRAFAETLWLKNKRQENPLVIVNHILIDGYGCKGNVSIPESVTSITEFAFSNCTNLESVTIPNSVTSIEGSAFSNCTNLESVMIPESVTSIGSRAFAETLWLKNKRQENPLVIVNHILIDGYGCKGNVSIPESVISIAGSAFYNCSGLESVIIPDSITSIAESTFFSCSNLESVTIPESVTSIAESVFSNCSSLESITIPNSVISIADSAFQGCSGLKSVTIPASVANIGSNVFSNCSSLVDISIPGSVTSIGSGAFSGTQWLERQREKNSCVVVNHILIDGKACSGSIETPVGVTSIGNLAFYGCSSLISINISNGVTNIGYGAFDGCENLTSVYIPDSMTNIEDDAFIGCSSLKSLSISNNVISIGSWAFARCNSLTNVSIPEGVISIGAYAFYDCNRLADISIPRSVVNIGKDAFISSSNLVLRVFPDSFAEVYAKKNNIKYSYIGDGENPICDHTWNTSTNKATTKKNGIIIKTCTRCGKKITTIIYAPETIKLYKKSYTYNGKVQKPAVTIKDSQGKVLSSKKSYKVSYPKAIKNVGSYTMTIKFKGNYIGTVKKTFYIVPKGTFVLKVTSRKKGFTVKWKKQATQTTGYEIAYSTDRKFSKKNTKIVSIEKNNVTSKSVNKLKAKKKYYLRIRTYKIVKGKKYYSEWSKMKHVITKK